jgi:hypothetical protein
VICGIRRLLAEMGRWLAWLTGGDNSDGTGDDGDCDADTTACRHVAGNAPHSKELSLQFWGCAVFASCRWRWVCGCLRSREGLSVMVLGASVTAKEVELHEATSQEMSSTCCITFISVLVMHTIDLDALAILFARRLNVTFGGGPRRCR